jgi:hypothetical protein
MWQRKLALSILPITAPLLSYSISYITFREQLCYYPKHTLLFGIAVDAARDTAYFQSEAREVCLVSGLLFVVSWK